MAGAPEAARARGALPPISIERANSPSLGVLSPTRRSPARHSPASHSPTRHSPPTKPPFVRASSEQLEGCSAQRDDPSPHGLTIQCLGSPRIQSLRQVSRKSHTSLTQVSHARASVSSVSHASLARKSRTHVSHTQVSHASLARKSRTQVSHASLARTCLHASPTRNSLSLTHARAPLFVPHARVTHGHATPTQAPADADADFFPMLIPLSNFSLELGHADGVSPSAGGGGGGGFSTRSSVCSLEDSWKGKSSDLWGVGVFYY